MTPEARRLAIVASVKRIDIARWLGFDSRTLEPRQDFLLGPEYEAHRMYIKQTKNKNGRP